MATANIGLERLVDLPLRLADNEPDLRGLDVHDADGEKLGTVSSLFVDESDRRVRFLEVSGGGILGLGDREILIPVEAISRFDDKGGVHLSRMSSRIQDAPAYDPTLIDDRTYWEHVYGWYGYPPFWAAGVAPMTPPWR